ncbi:hypothetical protein J8TS2_15710 [Lederbergia ruris]|uniref:Transposase n=1 Tax=Lederbergia ruris TaxID=217495 RepID=A0ABQ4KH18_9BACI|nr:hypothetical protein [Lederbergia ruris]GIN57252.1 hypothetical protein J8TS2_15710 [Lederbergia ruris]
MLVKMELDPARQRLVYGFFERYLTLDEEEEKQLMNEINYMDEAERIKIMEIPISYEEKGIEKGKEIGEKSGKRKVAVEMLKEGLSSELIVKVTKLKKEEIEELKKKL